jgi:hypothetical protein
MSGYRRSGSVSWDPVRVEKEMIAKPNVLESVILLSSENCAARHVIPENRQRVIFPESGSYFYLEPWQYSSTISTISRRFERSFC